MIEVEQDGLVARILLNRPERGNALDREAVRDLRTALRALGDEIELVIIRGGGDRAFCGGADAREMVALGSTERQAAVGDFCDLGIELWEHPALTVAQLDGGYATGGGAHVAMACDLRTGAPGSWIQFGSARYGLSITAVWLALQVGPATATALLASARKVEAEEALALGLLQSLSQGDAALDELGIAGGESCREAKDAVRHALPSGIGDALRVERERAVERVALDRFVETLSREPSATPR